MTSAYECEFCGLRIRHQAGKTGLGHTHHEEEACRIARARGYRVTPTFCDFPLRELGPVSGAAEPLLGQVWMA